MAKIAVSNVLNEFKVIFDHTQRLNAPLKKSKNPHLKAEGGGGQTWRLA